MTLNLQDLDLSETLPFQGFIPSFNEFQLQNGIINAELSVSISQNKIEKLFSMICVLVI